VYSVPRWILVTNDDGIYSRGLKILYDAVNSLGDTIVFAPETPKSASGLGITLHKPLRIQKVEYWDIQIYITNGTPSDIIYLALNEISPRLDLVVSGINIGDNTSVQVILSSGTVGAAAQAALMGVPAIAYSAAVEDNSGFKRPQYARVLTLVSKKIAELVLERGLPPGVDVLNVNYPRVITPETRVKVARVAPIKFLQRVNVNYDPRGNKYYWLYGMLAEPIPGTDVHSVHVEGNITISPLHFNLNPRNTSKELEEQMRVLVRETGAALEEALSEEASARVS
jgi:5'-nucleotidase